MFLKLLNLFKLENKLAYREFEIKIKEIIPFINIYIYNLNIFLRSLIFIIVLLIVGFLVKSGIVSLIYIYYLLIFLAFCSMYFTEDSIAIQNDRYKLNTYMLSGVFTDKEKEKNRDCLTTYYTIKYTSIILLVQIFICVLIFQKKSKYLFPYILFNINFLIFFILVTVKKLKKALNKYIIKDKYAFKQKKLNILKIAFIIFLIIIFKNINFKIEFNISFLFNNLLNEAVKISSIIINNKNFIWSNFCILFFQLVIIFTCNKTTINKKNLSKEKLNPFDNKVNLILKPLQREFWNKEIRSKIISYLVIGLFFIIFDFINIKANLILMLIFCFLFTPFNQRYLLNNSFVNYLKFVNNKNVLYLLIRRLLPVIMLLLNFFILLLNPINKFLLIKLIINNLVVMVNIAIQVCLYSYGFNRKVENQKKMNSVEISSGAIYILQIITIIMG